MLHKIIISSLLGISLFGFVAQAAQTQNSSLSSKQKKEMGEVVREYLLANPGLLMEVSQKARAQQMEVAQKNTTKLISENLGQLYSKTSPVLGNPDGDVVLVQFFDYQCGYCKQMDGVIAELITSNKNLKVFCKNLAVLGPNSQLAAKASIASGFQNKFLELHGAFIQSQEPLSKDKILELAKKVGIDSARLEKDMESPEVAKQLAENSMLAGKAGINGTPAFVVTSKAGVANPKVFFAPGAIAKETLQDYINRAKS